MSLIQRLRDRVFTQIHSSNLIYNTCWEDPRCDRAMLGFDAESQVVMITSAGCNALDYLLDNPASIHAIDMNHRQNALLELKKAAITNLTHEQLFELFGRGKSASFTKWLAKEFKPVLPDYAYKFWQKNSYYFATSGVRSSFYYHGTSGVIAWFFRKYLQIRPRVMRDVHQLFEATSIADQAPIYAKVEKRLFSPFVKWLSSTHLTFALAGVPRAQRNLIAEEHPEGVQGFLMDSLRHVFTKISTHDNYFWYLYIFGHYEPTICPNYLLPENFDTLNERAARIHVHTQTIADFLKENPAEYSHYILLDHQDWLANHAPEALDEEWRLILKNSKRGTKILLRSAAMRIDFLPAFVTDAITFDMQTAEKMHQLDRVGTYGSVYFGTVN